MAVGLLAGTIGFLVGLGVAAFVAIVTLASDVDA